MQVWRRYPSFTSAWNCVSMRCNFSTASVFPTTLACIFRAQHGAHSIHSYGMNQWNVIKHVLCNSAWQRDFQSFLPGHSRLHSTDKKKHLVSLPPKHIVNTAWTLPSVICEVSPWLRGNGSWLVAVHGSIRLGLSDKTPSCSSSFRGVTEACDFAAALS